MSARDEVLRRVRAATATVPSSEPVAWEPDGDPSSSYLRRREEDSRARRRLFVSRMQEHGARVTEVDSQETIATTIEGICARLRIASAVSPPDLPPHWAPRGVEVVADAPALDLTALAGTRCLLSGAALAIAETATIVLDGGEAQGRRALSLVPDVHLCVLGTSQLVGGVPEAIERLAPAAGQGRPLTLISGPSATVDIAFERVVGVHGPRTVEVVLVDDEKAVPFRAIIGPS